MARKIAVLLFVFGVAGCHRAPDADYLRDYAQAHQLIDAYGGDHEKLDRAQALLDGLLKKRPDLPHAYVELSRIAMSQGMLGRAQEQLQTAIRLDPKFCDGHVVSGHLYFRMKRYGEALRALDRADALACTSPWRLINRVQVDLDLQKFDEASAVLALVPAANASSPPALHRIIETRALDAKIWIAFSKGNQEEMLAAIHQQLALVAPDDAWGIGNAAVSLMQAGAFEASAESAREALRRMQYGAARHTLGLALFGDSIWRDSRSRTGTGDAKAADEWKEAQSILSFDEASSYLWTSLANRDMSFRALLQTKMLAARAEKAAQEPSSK